VPLIAYQYWRDVRMLHMPRLAAIWRPNGPALDWKRRPCRRWLWRRL